MGYCAVWVGETPGAFHASIADGWHRRHMVVERLPEGGWDWVAWLADEPDHRCDGCAVTEREAMRAAELACRQLAEADVA